MTESMVEPKLTNNTCPECGGGFTGEQFEFCTDTLVSQDVTCGGCGRVFRHYYTLTGVEEVEGVV